ncbi:MAG: hypothetical protein ACD_71C00124G0009 [uncultured bacterium (gcode 4)]|uniref:Adenylate kinase n=1 Tax=uncultured bacterium (gcode 4) TaxID=1234023 RepID=K1Z4K7_9BACT|nr:MAG: hypothetical protein ACD_71C00124G0009 [uncultured bacterium (gcode 4)]
MENPSIIYVSWIHGVGKSTLCVKVANKIHVQYLIASALLRKYKADTDMQCSSTDQIDKDIDTVLFWVQSEMDIENTTLLDGHFVLYDRNKKKVIPIKKDFFDSIPIKHIFVLVDTISEIQKKLLKRGGEMLYTKDFIQEFQKAEVLHANTIARELWIPLSIMDLSKEDYPEDIILRSISE